MVRTLTRSAIAMLAFAFLAPSAEAQTKSPAKPAKATAKAPKSTTKTTSATTKRSTSPAKRTKSPFQIISVEQSIVNRTNAERARYGLPPLSVCPNLMHSARSHTMWMTSAQRLQHTSAPVAENIAEGQTSTSEALHSWMTSPGHRANILNGRYRRIGVAAYRARNGRTYWCQQFN